MLYISILFFFIQSSLPSIFSYLIFVTKTPETRGVSGASFLKFPQFLIGRCVFRLPFSQSPVCTFDEPFSLAFQSTYDLRRRPISGSAFQPNLRLSSTVRSFEQVLQSISSLRLRPIFEPSLPVNPSTCVSDRPSSSAFQSACDSRRLPIFGPAFQLTSSLRLRPIF